MPFKSKAQQGWIFANDPEMAKRWARHTKDIKSLPAHVAKEATLFGLELFQSLPEVQAAFSCAQSPPRASSPTRGTMLFPPNCDLRDPFSVAKHAGAHSRLSYGVKMAINSGAPTFAPMLPGEGYRNLKNRQLPGVSPVPDTNDASIDDSRSVSPTEPNVVLDKEAVTLTGLDAFLEVCAMFPGAPVPSLQATATQAMTAKPNIPSVMQPKPIVQAPPMLNPVGPQMGNPTARNPFPGAPNPLGAGSLHYHGERATGMGDSMKHAHVKQALGEQALLRMAPALLGAAETGVDTVGAGINNPEHPGRAMGRALFTGLGTTGGIIAGGLLGRHYGGTTGEIAGGVGGALAGGLGGTLLGRTLVHGDRENEEKQAAEGANQLRERIYGGRKVKMIYGTKTRRDGKFTSPGSSIKNKQASLHDGLASLVGLGVLTSVPVAAGIGAAKAPAGHRFEGAYRGASHWGNTLVGGATGGILGGALGAGIGAATGGDNSMLTGAALGGAVGAGVGGMAGHKMWDWTMPQPTWERKREDQQLEPANSAHSSFPDSGGSIDAKLASAAQSFRIPRDPFGPSDGFMRIVRTLRRAYAPLGHAPKTLSPGQCEQMCPCDCEDDAPDEKQARSELPVIGIMKFAAKHKGIVAMGAGVAPSVAYQPSMFGPGAKKNKPFFHPEPGGDGDYQPSTRKRKKHLDNDQSGDPLRGAVRRPG